MSPHTNINADMTRYLPDDSQMKQGLDKMSEEFGSDAVGTGIVRVMFWSLPDSLKTATKDDLSSIDGVSNILYQSGSEEYNRGDKVLFELLCGSQRSQEEIANEIADKFGDKVIVEKSENGTTAPMGVILIALVLLLIVLFIMCESWLEPPIFLAAIGVAVAINMGTNALLKSVSVTTHSIAAILQLVLSIDYSIILMNRYRQEKSLGNGDDITSMINALNKYATPEFEKFARQMREYYLAGYIDPAIAIGETATDTWRNAQNTANYLISSEVSLYGYEYTTSEARGIQVAYVMTTDAPYIDNTSVQGAMMAISANSAHPVEAMKFLALLNTDPYVMTLLNYGVEGIHYTLNAEGEVEFNADARATYSPWTNGVGNVTLLPPQKGQGADFQQRFAEFYAGSKKLPIYGFTFDSKPVETEIAQIANIKEAYALSLCTGAVDVDEKLPELLSKLEDNGMQKIVDEANAQLKAFLGE